MFALVLFEAFSAAVGCFAAVFALAEWFVLCFFVLAVSCVGAVTD